MKEITVPIVGTTALLMHSTAGMSIEGGNKGLRKKSDIITGPEEAEVGAYRDEDGWLVLPTLAFQRSLFKAASGRKVGKITARLALAGVMQTTEFVRLVDPKTTEFIKDFDVDTRFVKVNGSRVPRSRARINAWAVELTMEYDDQLIGVGDITDLFEIAGKIVGVGDYRPETGGGPFGRFVVST